MTKQKRNLTIAGGVVAALVITAVALGLPAYLSNYVDMLQAMRAFDKANKAYTAKEYEDAIEFYAEATENAPADHAIIQTVLPFFTASSHHLLYKPSVTDDPDNEANLDAAVDGYQDTIEIVKARLADPLVQQADKDTIGIYERYASEQLAGLYRDYLDDIEMAEHYFNRLIEMDPGNPARWYALGDVYERFHDPEENPLLERAIEVYQKPVEMDPDDPIAYRQVANLLNRYGRFDETMDWLARARDVDTQNPEGYYLIATYYWDKVYRDPDLTQRERRSYIDLGIGQLDAALELNDEYVDALVYKNLLLREKAKVEPRNASALIAEADGYRTRALEIRTELEEAAKAEAAAAAEAAAQNR